MEITLLTTQDLLEVADLCFIFLQARRDKVIGTDGQYTRAVFLTDQTCFSTTGAVPNARLRALYPKLGCRSRKRFCFLVGIYQS